MRNLFWGLILIAFILGSLAFSAETFLSTRQKIVTAGQRMANFDETASDSNLCLDTVWSEFANRACMEVARETNCIEKNILLASVSGTRAYEVDTAILNILWTVRVENKTQVPIKQFPAPYLAEIAGDTVLAEDESPTAYWFNGDSLIFYPTPVGVDTFLVGYSVYPHYLDMDTSTVNIPLEYREAVVLYICHLFQMRAGKYEDATAFLAFYDKKIAKYRTEKAAHYDRPQVSQ